jgi:hypothetical protein
VAEWLRSGLQIRVLRFESGRGLQINRPMAKQQSDKSDKTKRRRGPPSMDVGVLIGVRIQSDDLYLLDAWRAKQADKPGRPEAIRRLVEQALSEKGNERPD